MFPYIQALRHPQQYLYQIRCVAGKKRKSNHPEKFPALCTSLIYSGIRVRHHVKVCGSLLIQVNLLLPNSSLLKRLSETHLDLSPKEGVALLVTQIIKF